MPVSTPMSPGLTSPSAPVTTGNSPIVPNPNTRSFSKAVRIDGIDPNHVLRLNNEVIAPRLWRNPNNPTHILLDQNLNDWLVTILKLPKDSKIAAAANVEIRAGKPVYRALSVAVYPSGLGQQAYAVYNIHWDGRVTVATIPFQTGSAELAPPAPVPPKGEGNDRSF